VDVSRVARRRMRIVREIIGDSSWKLCHCNDGYAKDRTGAERCFGRYG